LLRRQGFVPKAIVTDKLRSYGAALRKIGFSGLHEQGLRANNRAENSHQPLRRRERKMQGFKSIKSAQRFVSVHAAVYNTFNVQRHLIRRRRGLPKIRLRQRKARGFDSPCCSIKGRVGEFARQLAENAPRVMD
jgi:hypothetical protein